MKKLLCLFIIALLVSLLAVTVSATEVTTLPEKCEHCGVEVTWTPLSSAEIRETVDLTTGHYYVAMEEAIFDSVTKKIKADQNVCLYLNGKTVAGTTRGFTVFSGGTLNIMGEGKWTGRGTTAGMEGACGYVEAGGTLNQYGGTLAYVTYMQRHSTNGGVLYIAGTYNLYDGVVENGIATDAEKLCNGGNIFVASGGEFNMYGGTVQNGSANNVGGNVYCHAKATFRLKGGNITGGTASVTGNCVYNRGKLILSGSGRCDEILLNTDTANGGPELGNMLSLEGDFSGSVGLRLKGAAVGMDIGNTQGGTISGKLSIRGDMLCAIADGENIVLAEDDMAVDAYCDHCKKTVEWVAVDKAATELFTGHYYAVSDITDFTAKNVYVNSTVCFNLNGMTVNGTTRAFCVYPGGELNIMGDGTVTGRGSNEKSPKGGVITIQKDGTLNIYSGTLTFVPATDTGLSVLNGGILNIAGRCNMYGGQILDGQCSNAGGNVFIDPTGVFYMSGGYINNGKMGTSNNCIYNRGTAIFTGNARIESINQKPNVADGGPELKDMLIITGEFTGSLSLRGSSVLGTDMGNLQNADFSGATISIPGSGGLKAAAFGNELILGNSSPVLSFAADGTATGYASLEAAVAAYNDPEAVLVLMQDVTTAVRVDSTVTLDLNGYCVKEGFTGSGKVILKDACTDDNTVADGSYGAVKETAFALEAAEGYMLVNQDGQISSHKFSYEITAMSLRPNAIGVYFTAAFGGDEVVAANVRGFGVALNAYEVPRESNMDTTSLYSTFSSEQWICGTDSIINGTILVNIMQQDNTVLTNVENAQRMIYGKAYIRTDDGYLFGQLKGFSLQQLVEQIDLELATLTGAQKSAAVEMLRTYGQEMSQWNIPNLKEELRLVDLYAQVEKTATDTDIAVLTGLYSGTQARFGELHDHGATTGTSDGHQPLEVWKAYMEALNMDFATLVDHKQVLHMRLEEWDNVIFVGGSEAATTITDREGVKLHYNMTFAEPEGLEAVLNAFPEFKFRLWSESDRAGCGGQMHFNYPDFTAARFTELCEAIYANGGFMSIVHPKAGSYVTSEIPEDAWFADYTGVEVYYTYNGDRDNWVVQENYKLWTGMLAAGKKVFATSGNDQHNMPTTNALSTFYTTEAHATQYVANLRVGNFTAGPVGIRMAVGQTPMGGTVSFAGQRLVFCVGDFHDCVYNPDHTYRVDLYSDEGVVFSQAISCEEISYFAVDAQDVNFYRVEVWDTTDNSRLAIGNPIWNAD